MDTAPTPVQQEVLLILGRVDANVVNLLDITASHDTRLRALERSHWTIKAALMGIAGFVFKDHVPTFIANILT